MEQRQPDPFFEQLKADIQEGIDEANRGEGADEADVWEHFRKRSEELRRQEPSELSN